MEEKNYFEIDGVYFEHLVTHPLFKRGSLLILRADLEYDRASEIKEAGTQVAVVCFQGLRRLFFGNDNRSWATSTISAVDCEPGDELILEVTHPDFDLVQHLSK